MNRNVDHLDDRERVDLQTIETMDEKNLDDQKMTFPRTVYQIARFRRDLQIYLIRMPSCSSLSCCKTIKGPPLTGDPFIENMSGGDLLSHFLTKAVPSAQKGLASGFGM